MMQTIVHFFSLPTEMFCILCHLETGGCYATCVNGLTRRKEDTVGLEEMDSARLASHVGNLATTPATVGFELLCIVLGKLVLEGTRQGDVARDRPCFLSRCELTILRELIRHILYFITVRCTHNEHIINHFLGDTVRDGYHAVRTGDRHHLSAQLDRFGSRAPSHVTEAGDRYFLALDILACFVEQVLREVECAETGRLGTKDRTAPRHAFSGQHTCMILARELLVHTVEETDLTTAYAYVTCRDILVGTDAAPELEHKRLAETHNLCVGLAYRIKVRTTFGATHRKGRQRILESLLEAQELKHGRRNGTVETKTALVRTNRRIELHTIAEVRLDLPCIVNPRYTERKDTIGLNHALHDLCLFEFRVLIVHLFNRL